jgi:hypothetical protein
LKKRSKKLLLLQVMGIICCAPMTPPNKIFGLPGTRHWFKRAGQHLHPEKQRTKEPSHG